jgi:hypothetical protein
LTAKVENPPSWDAMSSEPLATLVRPIVVVGAPRSGTTLLGKLLGSHPALAHLDEPRLTWRYGNDAKSDMLSPEDARPEVCQHIRATFDAAIRKAGKQRLIEKTPSNSLRMGFVDRVLPGCLFVHIIRDGVESTLAIRRFWQQHARGVMRHKLVERLREINPRRLPYYFREFVRRTMPKPLAGLVKQPVWGPRIPGIDGMLQELELIEVCALQWRTCVEAARDYGHTLPRDRYFECRLEELTPEVLGRLLQFCQLEDSPDVWQTFEREFDPSQTTYRRSQAMPADVDAIRRWIEPTMTWLAATSVSSESESL